MTQDTHNTQIVRPWTPSKNNRNSTGFRTPRRLTGEKYPPYPVTSPFTRGGEDRDEEINDEVPIGSEQLPFFDDETQNVFADKMESISDSLKKLGEENDSLTNFNESIGSFLFGLNINAWCVHFKNSPNQRTWEEWRKVQEIDKEIEDMKRQITELERTESGKRESTIRYNQRKRRRGISLNLASARKTKVVESSRPWKRQPASSWEIKGRPPFR